MTGEAERRSNGNGGGNGAGSGNNGPFQPIEGFEIVERLGSGGMGTVYRARQISMDRVVALKILKKSVLRDALPLERLRREALLVASMDHPNIVKGIDLGETPRYYYFVMEFVEGKSVQYLIDRHGPIPEIRAARIIKDMAEALDHAFQRDIIHRDIKPGNIIVGRDGSARLADLGLAKGIMNLSITREGTTVGTPKYMSPEQARDAASADIRSDIYSLGVTFYHMVTGQPPIEGESVAQVITNVLFGKIASPGKINPRVSRITSRVIARMMARSPARRYQTPRELLDDLGILVEALRDKTERLSDFVGLSWNESQRTRSRRRAVLLFLLPAVVLGAAAIWFLSTFYGNDHENGETPEKGLTFEMLQSSYARGDLPPAEALIRLADVLAASDADSLSDAGTFRAMILTDSRRIVTDRVRPDSPRINRTLGAAGFADGEEAVRDALTAEVCNALGCEEENIPPDLHGYLTEKLEDVSFAVRDLVSRARSAVLKRTFELLDEEAKAVDADLLAGDFVPSLERVAALDEGRRDLARTAVIETIPLLLGEGDPDFLENPDPGRFLEESVVKGFLDKQAEVVDELEARLEEEARDAAIKYGEMLQAAVRMAVEGTDLETARLGIAALVEKVVEEKDNLRPRLPVELGYLLPDLEKMAAALEPRLDERLGEMQNDFGENEKARVLLAIEGPMRLGDGDAALDLLRRELEKDPSFPVPGYLDLWLRRIETVAKIEGWALDAFSKHRNLDLIVETRNGVTYQGELLSVDRDSAALVLKGPLDRSLKLSFRDLTVNEVLRWARKSFKLSPVETFLFLYYSGEMAEAGVLLGAIDDFDSKPFFRSRIHSISRVAAEESARIDNEYLALLDMGNRALRAGDAEGLGRILDELEANEARFSTGVAWARTRMSREKLIEGIEDIRSRQAAKQRLAENFSVHVDSLEKNRIRVKYTFDDPAELKDFKVRGRGYELEDGGLLFMGDRRGGETTPFDSRVGIRFGKGFDPGQALTVSFSYTAPTDGEGPCFLLISFNGECVGVRSFPGSAHTGQTAGWSGDLNDWEDYFFFPDLGEEKPRKGRTVPFGFNRGERYSIEVRWNVQELLFVVDGETVLRRRSSRLKGKQCEIKTLKAARFDNLTIEGVFRGN